MKTFFRDLNSTMSQALTPVVKWLFYISVGSFILITLSRLFGHLAPSFLVSNLGASLNGILHGKIWQLITYAFVHAGLFHLMFNLLAIYFFGQRLEHRWGSSSFLKFVIVVIVGAVLVHLSVAGINAAVTGQGGNDTIVGISGLVYGVMLACAIYYPDDVVYLQFLIPIKMKFLVAIMAFITIVSSLEGSAGSGIAHLTHLGGLVFAFLYIKVPVLFDWIPEPRIPFRKKPKFVDPRERWRKF